MTLENQVAQLVLSTQGLQNTVAGELAKVRAENTQFQTTVVGKAASAYDNGVVIFDGASGRNIKCAGGTLINQFGGAFFDGVFIGLGVGTRSASNCFVGANQATNTTGTCNTALGQQTFLANTTGNHNTSIGYNCLQLNTTGNYNTGIGVNSLLFNTTGIENIGLGGSALGSNTSGNSNTAVGYWALNDGGANNYSNCSGLGNRAAVTGSNQVQLGNSATTTYVYNTVQSRSDRRDKTDIQPTKLGLAFILDLNPVDFRWDMRDFYRTPAPEPLTGTETEEEVITYQVALKKHQEENKISNLTPNGSRKKKRLHHGLIAQDIQELIKSGKIDDFGGFQDHKISDGEDVLSIGYDEFVGPLIKSVQELAQANEELRGRIAILEARK